MHITRFAEALPYVAPKHFDMRSLRLQGFEVSASRFAWTGLSHFLPGGGAEMDASPLEKIYVVLRELDSCFIPGNEARAVRNKGNSVATMLVVMPHHGPRP